MDCSLPGSSVHGILQARILEWVAMPSSRGSSQSRDRTCISYVSCIPGGFFTTRATWEAQIMNSKTLKGQSPTATSEVRQAQDGYYKRPCTERRQGQADHLSHSPGWPTDPAPLSPHLRNQVLPSASPPFRLWPRASDRGSHSLSLKHKSQQSLAWISLLASY